MNQEFRKIIERAYDYCRENVNSRWILEPDDSLIGFFKGILFGSLDSLIPGSAYAFTLEIDHADLSSPPKIHFEKVITHPFTFKYGQDPGCWFCMQPEITCRSDMDTILTSLYLNFFLASQFKGHFNMKPSRPDLTNAFDKDAAKLVVGKNKERFWEELGDKGILGKPSIVIPEKETPAPENPQKNADDE